jgi:hypothetical protein
MLDVHAKKRETMMFYVSKKSDQSHIRDVLMMFVQTRSFTHIYSLICNGSVIYTPPLMPQNPFSVAQWLGVLTLFNLHLPTELVCEWFPPQQTMENILLLPDRIRSFALKSLWIHPRHIRTRSPNVFCADILDHQAAERVRMHDATVWIQRTWRSMYYRPDKPGGQQAVGRLYARFASS